MKTHLKHNFLIGMPVNGSLHMLNQGKPIFYRFPHPYIRTL